MDYRESAKKIVAELCRLLLGVVFLFSGTVKAIDPMGGAIKIVDYLTSFGLDWLQPFALLISFNLLAIEFLLGVCMLLGVYRRYTSLLMLLMMSFMTPLTLYLAIFNPVSDCGCFGDALVLTNWQTFYKNIPLLAASIYLLFHNQRLSRVYSYHAYWFVALWSYLFAIGFAYYNYNHLPIMDFRPYKVGANIESLISIPEGAPEDEYLYSFIYEKDGVRREFALEEVPADDSTWTFVESKSKLIRQGYIPPVSNFNIFDMDDVDVTDRILSSTKPIFLLISPRLEEADEAHADEFNNVYDYALENGIDFYCLTGSSVEEMQRWSDYTGAEYPFLMADDVLLKTMIRSNPGLMLLRKGSILMKWHYNDTPSEEELPNLVEEYLTGESGQKRQEYALLITNILSFAVPLSLVWIYDMIRGRRRRERKEV